ncbi:GntR family transcriptional regulator [Allokutzneria sp. A3M-2-11 16]|uniref:GntR family transcriptional regulator n=1 Tax=Allokutzneria sp. A3M-2-11 16 TaxID=2962043 RepID=UPI0020B7CE98|nr:GntR family transcriptional regulator [Allokutzneria sp. A3M-2-11 16]MCP3799119.1 GntR family transcriptional regulator [Allokutzneria sp. A3M-2-11 16]
MARHGYREIADEIRSLIDSGALPPGSKVLGENEIMAQYGVEQPTARRALDVLKNEGLIVARRGSGTYVREFRPIRRVSPDRLNKTVWGSDRSIWSATDNRRLSVTDVRVSKESAPPHIAHVLALTPEEQVIVRRRRYVVEEQSIQLATTYYPAALVKDSAIAEADTGVGGAYARLKDLGHEPVHFREELRTRMPRADEVKALQLVQGTPVIEIMRTAYTEANVPVELNEMVLDSSSYVLEYKFSAHSN